MTWLVWRQHRKQLLFGVVALLVLGAFFVGTGRPIHDRFEQLGLPECLPQTIDTTVVAELFGGRREPRRCDSSDHQVRSDGS